MGICNGIQQIKAVHSMQRPPSGQGHNLFAAERFSGEVGTFKELVLCPSRHGAHIISYKDNSLLYKIKSSISVQREYARLNIYQALSTGKISRTSVGELEKSRTILTATMGRYSMIQAWHLTTCKLEVKNRKCVLSPTKSKPLPTPVDTAAVNMHVKVSGSRDYTKGRGIELWEAEFAFSDPDYRMQLERQNHPSLNSIKKARVYRGDELVAAGQIQDFAHLGRPHYERPFMGIQLRANLTKPTRRNNEIAENHTELIPMLMLIAWGEFVVSPPHDARSAFLKTMRGDNRSGTVSTDIGFDTMVTAASAAATAKGAPKADGPKSDEWLKWALEPPLPPGGLISTHLRSPGSAGKAFRHNVSGAGSISLMGV